MIPAESPPPSAGKLHRLMACAVFALSSLVSCDDPRDVLGPRDKPDLSSEKWDKLQVSYWVFTTGPENEIKRTFTISAQSDVARLNTALKAKEVCGLSIGTRDQLVFKRGGEDTWHGDFCFEDTLYLSSSKDSWRSYKFVLSNPAFYDEVRRLCALHENAFHPEAKPEHIKLRNNLAVEYPRLGSKDKQ